MLVLLPIKYVLCLQPSFLQAKSSNWLRLRAILRRPMRCDDLMDIDLASQGSSYRFKATEARSGELVARGVFGTSIMVAANESGVRRTIPHADLSLYRRAFIDAFPGISSRWILLDALAFGMFSQLIGSMITCNGAYHTVEQVNHVVLFHTDLLRSQQNLSGCDIGYTLQLLQMAEARLGQVATASITIDFAGRPMMRCDIGLVSSRHNSRL